MNQDPQSQTDPTQAASELPPTTVSLKKKNPLWLWVTLGITLLVVIALGVSYFVVKNAGDAVAKTYSANAQTYLDKVYDTATSAANNPGQVKKDVEAVKAPVLESTLLGGLSSDYVASGKLNTEVTNRVATLTKTIEANAQVYTFYTDYKSNYSDLRALDSKGATAIFLKSRSGVSTYLSDFKDKLAQQKRLIDKATVPNELSTALNDLGRVYGQMSTNWTSMESAFDSNNSPAYNASYDGFMTASDGLTAAEKPVVEYYNTLSSKTNDAAKQLQVYRNTLR